MTHFATADDRRRSLLRRAARALHATSSASAPAATDLIVHAANSAATLRDPATHFDMVRCGVAIYGLDPFQEDPGAHGLEPALSLHRGSPRCGASSRATAPATGGAGRPSSPPGSPRCRSATATAGGGPHERLRRADRRPAPPLVGTVSMDNVTVDARGRHRRRGGRRGRADRRAGRRAHPCRGGGAPARHDQLRGHHGPPAARAAREHARGERGRWVVGGTLRDELLGRAGRPTSTSRSTGDPEPARARELAGRAARAGLPAVRGVRRLAGDRPRAGASTTSRRSRATTIEEDLARATSRSTRWRVPLRGRRADRPARRPGGPRGAARCACSGRRPTMPTRCGRCGWRASPPSSASRPTPETSGSPRAAAPRVTEASGERMFAELRRLVLAPGRARGLALADRLGPAARGAPRARRAARAWSRATSTTSTSTGTRSRCSSG